MVSRPNDSSVAQKLESTWKSVLGGQISCTVIVHNSARGYCVENINGNCLHDTGKTKPSAILSIKIRANQKRILWGLNYWPVRRKKGFMCLVVLYT